MKYKNISDQPLAVPNVNGTISVKPGAEVLTAKKFAQSLVDAGLLELVTEKKTSKKSTSKGDQ